MARPTPSPNAQRLLQGARFDVYKVPYPTRSGGQHDREVVVPANAVAILPLLDDDTLVLIRNERPSVRQTLWEIPAGTLEDGEDADACAARELVEETGYAAATLRPLTRFYTTPGFCTEQMHAYLATGLTFQGQDLDETEKIESYQVPLDEALQMARDGRIIDGKTIATLLYYLQFVRNQS